MKAVREIVEGALECGIAILTLFAFSDENWNRPAREIDALMRLLQEYVARELDELHEQGVHVAVLGDLSKLSPTAQAAVQRLMRNTAEGTRLTLNLCISYGSRAEIVRAAQRLAEEVARGERRPQDIDEAAFEQHLLTADLPDPDLLIRTSGELRISNFLLWQIAYTELYITPVLWPNFDRQNLFEAILDYQRRERRFGQVAV